jgi:hypothetical protein
MHVDHVVALERAADNNCMLGFSDIRVNWVQEFNGRIRACVFFYFFLKCGSHDIRSNCVKAFNGRIRVCFFFCWNLIVFRDFLWLRCLFLPCVCLCVRERESVCVCVKERERERERALGSETHARLRTVDVHTHALIAILKTPTHTQDGERGQVSLLEHQRQIRNERAHRPRIRTPPVGK